MSDGFSDPIIGGGGTLVYPAIHSPNFITGISGWTIKKDGSAEFNNLTIRGTFEGTDFILNASGAFFYSGTPATGNLIMSITSAAGTDGFGNAYLKGTVVYANDGFGTFVQMNAGLIVCGNTSFPTVAAGAGWLALGIGGTFQVGSGSTGGILALMAAGIVQVTSAGTFETNTLNSVSGAGITVKDSLIAENVHTINTGFPAGWSGAVFYWKLAEDGLVMVSIQLVIAAGTVITNGESLFTLPAGYRVMANTMELIPIFLNGGAGITQQALQFDSSGVVQWGSAGITTPGGGNSSIFCSRVIQTRA